MFSVLVIGFYMYFITQAIGMMTMVNHTTILCPAPSDPFYGPYYRIAALVATVSLTMVSGKIYFGIVSKIIQLMRPGKSEYAQKAIISDDKFKEN